jgi:hypothetical protein
MFALMPSDVSIIENEVIKSFSLVPQLAKKIEPVGQAYAKLQGKFMRSK